MKGDNIMKTNTTSSVKPGKNGYKILFATNTVIMNYKFAAAAAEYGTKEYKIMKGIEDYASDTACQCLRRSDPSMLAL